MLRPIEIQGGYTQSLNVANMQRSENNQVNVNHANAEHLVKKEIKAKTKKIVKSDESSNVRSYNRGTDINKGEDSKKGNKHINIEI